MCVALLKMAVGHRLAGKFNCLNGKIESYYFRAALQCACRQHAGATTYIQHLYAVRHTRRIEHGSYRLACHCAEDRIVADNIGVPAR